MGTTVRKRSVVVAGHRTSVSLERAFWDALRDMAQKDRKTINQLVSDIDTGRTGNLSSAIRVRLLAEARNGRLPFPGDETAGGPVALPDRAAASAPTD
jgi:predicted DNA-binding ribbon-helix-helix protein